MTTTQMPPSTDDPTELLAWLRRMRHEQPVWQGPNGAYQVFRYDDVRAVVADPGTFSSNLGKIMPFIDPERLSGNLVWTDPPAHRTPAGRQPGVHPEDNRRPAAAYRRVRGGVGGSGTGRRVRLRGQVRLSPAHHCDRRVARRVTADHQFFRDSAETSLGLRVTKAQSDEEKAALVAAATQDLDEYLLSHIQQRRAHPQDDLLSTLVAAEAEGRRLTDKELLSFATLLLNAGYLTTTLLLGNFLLCLRDDPTTASRLRAERSKIPQAIEEALRHRSPLPGVHRITTKEAEIAGTVIPANKLVTLSVLSANHDEQHFADPDRFDMDRDPGKHIAFGHGIHFCLGAPLARLEAEIATGVLFDEFAELEVSGGVEYHATEFYGPKRLEVKAKR
jgi:cytochrome P450